MCAAPGSTMMGHHSWLMQEVTPVPAVETVTPTLVWPAVTPAATLSPSAPRTPTSGLDTSAPSPTPPATLWWVTGRYTRRVTHVSTTMLSPGGGTSLIVVE